MPYEQQYRLLDYHLKAMRNSDSKAAILGNLNNMFSDLEVECINDIKNNFRNVIKNHPFFLSADDVKSYLKNAIDSVKEMNEDFMTYHIPPIFKDPTNLPECLAIRDKYVKLMPEKECNKALKCSSFDAYKPQKYNNVTQQIEPGM